CVGVTYLLVDPCEREERVMDGLLMIAMNKHREICSIQSSGGIMLLKEQVTRLKYHRASSSSFSLNFCFKGVLQNWV
ncbi:Exosome complex component RRP45, partial [Xenoophorus captivus]